MKFHAIRATSLSRINFVTTRPRDLCHDTALSRSHFRTLIMFFPNPSELTTSSWPYCYNALIVAAELYVGAICHYVFKVARPLFGVKEQPYVATDPTANDVGLF